MIKPVLNVRESRHRIATLVTALVVTCSLPLARSFAADTPADVPATQSVAQPADPADEWIEHLASDQNITNSLGMVLVWVPAGYRVAQYEVTQADYQMIMPENPSRFQGARKPVEQVSWNHAREFCRKLTKSEHTAGNLPEGYAYVLPTQTQWAYFVGDAALNDAITSHLGDRRQTEPVGALAPNQYGLYDVRGNVWEWCSEPVARGASWRSHEDYLAIDFRFVATPDAVYADIGFRVILQPPDAATAR